MKIIVEKNRSGSTGACMAIFNPSVGKFSNLAEQEKYSTAF